jgi:hypothetical protein
LLTVGDPIVAVPPLASAADACSAPAAAICAVLVSATLNDAAAGAVGSIRNWSPDAGTLDSEIVTPATLNTGPPVPEVPLGVTVWDVPVVWSVSV